MKRSHYFPWMGLIPLALGGCYVYSVAIPVVGTLLPQRKKLLLPDSV